jgi:SNF2 family DNA or RNA helicase
MAQSVEELISRPFGKKDFLRAQNLLRESCVSISFVRKRPGLSWIISGLVNDDITHITRATVTLKENDLTLKSHCDCRQWNESSHCPHVAALVLKFSLQQALIDGGPSQHTLNSSLDFGVHPEEYGTIIDGPHKLKGGLRNTTYAFNQYILTNKKVVSFPAPVEFQGVLILDLVPEPPPLPASRNNVQEPMSIRFSHLSKSGVSSSRISLFENLYLFNWDDGSAFSFNNDLRDFISLIRNKNVAWNMEDILLFCGNLIQSGQCALAFSGRVLPIKNIHPHARFSLFSSERRGFLQTIIDFHDDSGRPLPPPPLLAQLVFIGGALSDFKRKNDACTFLKLLHESFSREDIPWQGILRNTTHPEKLAEIASTLKNQDTSLAWSKVDEALIPYDNRDLRAMFTAILENFSDQFFRNSSYNRGTMGLVYQLPAQIINDGVSRFYTATRSVGLSIFFNQREVGTWRSRIKFERHLSGIDWFDLHLHINSPDMEVIKNADSQGLSAITSEGLVLLTPDQQALLKFVRQYVDAEKKSEKNGPDGEKIFTVPFRRARIFELFELMRYGIEGALTPEEITLCEMLSSLKQLPTYPIPLNYESIARPYQLTGYHWLRFLHENRMGACLADDMGLGKTLQVIMFLRSIMDRIERVLVVCPVSILINWELEVRKFSDMNAFIYHGGQRELPSDAKIIITSYGIMKKEVHDVFSKTHFDILVLDEVQHLKNRRSIGAGAARLLKTDFRICMTGTPVENDLAEFYNILDLCVPGVWGPQLPLRPEASKETRVLAKKTVRPFILRRTRPEVLADLPEKIEDCVYLDFTPEERGHYNHILSQIRQKLANVDDKRRYGEILKGLLELRQRCLWDKTETLPSTKVTFLIETLEQILKENHQCIIFSQFTSYLNIIQTKITQKHWKYSRIDGTQSMKRRQVEIDKFQGGENRIFLISLKAGGVGLNLTAASYVFLMDPWWNPAVEDQAIGRAHRIGQKNKLLVYRLIIRNSVEEKVLQLQEYKKELFTDLLSSEGDEYFTGKLSMKDFESLIEVPGQNR